MLIRSPVTHRLEAAKDYPCNREAEQLNQSPESWGIGRPDRLAKTNLRLRNWRTAVQAGILNPRAFVPAGTTIGHI